MYHALLDPNFTTRELCAGGRFAVILWMISALLLLRLITWCVGGVPFD